MLAGALVLLYLNAITAPYNHDEEQYVFAGLIAQDMNPYEDFVYLQTPYYPVALGLVFSMINEQYFYAARLLSLFFSVASCVIVFVIARRLTESSVVAGAVSVLFATSPVMIAAFGSARNDMMPCFFALLGVLLAYEGRRREAGRAPLHALAGVALSIAVGSKLSYAFVPAVVFLYVLLVRQGTGFLAHLRSSVLPLAGGGIVGALAMAYYAASAWDAFVYEVFTYHLSATAQWYAQNDLASQLSLRAQITELIRLLFRDTTLVAMCFIAFIILSEWSGKTINPFLRNLVRQDGALFVALAIGSVPFVLAPRPSHIQYFQPLIPYLALSVAALYAAAVSITAAARSTVLLAFTAVASLPGLAQLLASIGDPSTVKQVHAASQEVRRALAEMGVEGRVATLSPIRVIDAGTPVYREFAAGPFFFRTGDMLPVEQVSEWHGVSPATLHEFLGAEPPAAIFTGYEDDWLINPDAPLEAYARTCGYREIEGDFGKGKLFVRTDDRCTLQNHAFEPDRR